MYLSTEDACGYTHVPITKTAEKDYVLESHMSFASLGWGITGVVAHDRGMNVTWYLVLVLTFLTVLFKLVVHFRNIRTWDHMRYVHTCTLANLILQSHVIYSLLIGQSQFRMFRKWTTNLKSMVLLLCSSYLCCIGCILLSSVVETDYNWWINYIGDPDVYKHSNRSTTCPKRNVQPPQRAL